MRFLERNRDSEAVVELEPHATRLALQVRRTLCSKSSVIERWSNPRVVGKNIKTSKYAHVV